MESGNPPSSLPAARKLVGGKVGVVFDLDGVVYRSRPGGKDLVGNSLAALCALRANGIPFAFVTNSTGVLESEKAAFLSRILGGFRVSEKQVFMATTPMRALAETYKEQRVLVAGMGTEGDIALAYGFKDFVTLAAFARDRPQLLPQRKFASIMSKSGAEGSEVCVCFPFRRCVCLCLSVCPRHTRGRRVHYRDLNGFVLCGPIRT